MVLSSNNAISYVIYQLGVTAAKVFFSFFFLVRANLVMTVMC